MASHLRTALGALAAAAILAPLAACETADAGEGHTDEELCAVVTCQTHAHCEIAAGPQPVCVCDDGYSDQGGACVADDGDVCDPNPCILPFQSVCTVADDGSPACGCDEGYVDNGAGGCRSEDEDPCDPNPCNEEGRGQCVALPLGVTCECDPGLVEDAFGDCVESLIDLCDPNPCVEPHRSVCSDDGGFPRCDCDQGYAEDDLGECVPESDPCDPNPCDTVPNRTVCAPGDGGAAVCSCEAGYADDGQGGCEPVLSDPCDPNPCNTIAHMTRCEADGNLAVCSCDEGWHDDGQGGCSDDACVPNPCATEGQTQCAPSGAGVVCGCDAGWVPDGQGGCELEETGPCDPNPCGETLQTVCVEEGAGYRCECDAVAHEDGQGGCTLDPCLPNPCAALSHQTVCAADPTAADGYVCECDADYHLDGGVCVDACTPNPCTDPGKGACTPVGDEASCACDAGLHDDGQGGCTADPCLPDPCDANQVCEADGASYACVACADGDGDDYGVGDGCLGHDCDDEDSTVHEGCVCDGAHSAGDAYEEDECFFIAAAIASGETQPHTLEPSGDRDWVRFTVAAGDMITLAKSGSTSVSLALYDRDGTTELEDASSFVDRKLPAAGEYFARVSGSSTGAYDLTFTNLGQDDHGDGPDEATLVQADGATTNALTEIDGNVDWFAFDAVAAHQYQIHAKALDGQGISLALYAPDGTTELEARAASYSSTVLIDREDMAAGRYFLRVSDNYGNARSGAYELAVTDLGLDDHGDDAPAATALGTDGSATAGAFEVGGNVDWFSFDVVEGHLYQMWAVAEGTGVTLTLYDTDGVTEIEQSNVSYSSTAFIDREGLAAGTYYLSATPNYGNASTGGYEIYVRDIGVDDHGNAPDEATAIVADVDADGLFQVGGNVDWLAVELLDDHLYQFIGSAEGTGIKVALFDTDGTTLIIEASVSYSSTAFFDRGGLPGGTYFLRVRPNYGNTSTGSWQVRVVDLGLDDHANVATEATDADADGQTIDAEFEVSGDVDWYAFQAQSDHQYRVSAAGEGTGVRLALYGPDGETLLEESSVSYSSTASVDREDLDAATYYLRVRPNYGNASHGAYTLRIDDLGLDDHGDDADDATAVATDNAEVDGRFEVGGNVDWFAFDVAEGHLYAARVRPSGTGAKLALFDTDGTTLREEITTSYSTTAYLDRDDLAAGTWYLRVRPNYGTSSIGDYTVAVEDLGLDDHGRTYQTATALPGDGAAIAARFEVNGNVDWFSFDATDGGDHTLTCAPEDGQGCKIGVYAADGTTLLVTYSSSYSSALTRTWTGDGTGTRYLRVSPNYGTASRGDYTLTVTTP